MAATGRDGVFRSGPTIPTPTVCDSVSWVVEVRKGYQSVHIYVCTNEGLLWCNDLHNTPNPQIAQATTLRDPWIPARSKDP